MATATPSPIARPRHRVFAMELTSWIVMMNEKVVDEERIHQWLTDINLKLSEVVPAIPPMYDEEARAGRALMVFGLPKAANSTFLIEFFKPAGVVEYCPALTCITSLETFQWVVMRTAVVAKAVMTMFHGKVLDNGSILRLCKALPAGKHLVLGDKFKLEQLFPRPAAPKISPSPALAGSAVVVPKRTEATAMKPLIKGSENLAITPSKNLAHASSQQSPNLPELSSRLRDDEDSSIATPSSSPLTPQATSWANIANTADPSSSNVDLRPENKATSSAPRLKPVGRIPSVPGAQANEELLEQMRVVFLMNLPNTITLVDVSNAIIEGPICSIRFGNNTDDNSRYAGVIVQSAYDS